MPVTSAISKHLFKKILIGGVLEFSPIILFLLSFHHFHVYKATIILMVTTVISTGLTYLIQKRIPYLALYMLFLTVLFGYMTVSHHQPRFIQIRDTIYDATFALSLLVGLMFDIFFLKIAFGEISSMTTKAWTRVTYSWIFLFIAIAIANEYVRRTLSVEAWFEFKSIVVVATIIFGIITTYLFYERDDKS